MTEKAVSNKHSMNLHQKIAAITGEIGAISKDGTNKEQHYSFIEYDAIAGILREKMSEYGLLVIPNMGERQSDELTSARGNVGYHVLINFSMIVINADSPADREEYSWIGEATDWSDKSTNKASTAADKYFLMRLFKISSKGDDPDEATPPQSRPAHKEISGVEQARSANPTNKQMVVIELLFDQLGLADDQRQSILSKIKTVGQASDVLDQLQGKLRTKLEAEKVVGQDNDSEPIADMANLEQAEENVTSFLATDEIKQGVTDKLAQIGLSAIGTRRFIKETTGKLALSNIDDEGWMKLSSRVHAVLDNDEHLPEEWFAKAPETDGKSKAAGEETAE